MELLLKYFSNLTSKQVTQFSMLFDLYVEWNAKINVVSRKDINDLYLRHVLHSLGIAKVVMFKDGTTILDVGTGGGFPGIPLAILFPKCSFYLVDSVNKKIKVVDAVVASLELTNIKTSHKRAEDINKKFDFVVSRAVTAMPDFVGWVKDKVSEKSKHQLRNGILYLKGGDLTNELKSFKNVKITDLSDFFDEEFFDTKKVVSIAFPVQTYKL